MDIDGGGELDIEEFDVLFQKARDCWKEKCNLSSWKNIITDTCKTVNFDEMKTKINNKIFINFFDTSTCKEHIVSNFDTIEDVIESVYKSSYIPILIDGNLCYKNCVDGFNPMLFNERTEEDRKSLFIHLFTCDKIMSAINLKNDKNHSFRAIEGINEIHKFFINKKQSLCSYVNDWSTQQLLVYRIRQIVYYIIIYIIRLLVISKTLIPDAFYETPIWNLINQFGGKIYKDIFLQSCF